MGGDRKLIGRWGEEQAAAWLQGKGYRILAQGYRCRFGEIDLIAQKGRFLAFVEVKTRRDDRFSLAREAVTPAKRRRLIATAQLWLMEHPGRLQPRFDVIEVYYGEGLDRPRIDHLENAFTL